MFSSLSLLPDSVTQRVEETEQSTASGDEKLDTSTASRFEIWTGAALMWSEHPIGVGMNRFKRYIGHYSKYVGYDAHNFYVLTTAELGPLGIGALLRSEEHTSELQSLMRNSYAVFCLKKTTT